QPVQAGHQPAGARAERRAERAVIAQRPVMDEQVPDAGPFYPRDQGGQVRVAVPAIHPGVPEPHGIAAGGGNPPGRGARSLRVHVSEGRRGQEHGDYQQGKDGYEDKTTPVPGDPESWRWGIRHNETLPRQGGRAHGPRLTFPLASGTWRYS